MRVNGTKIDELLSEKGMTRKDLAQKTGIDYFSLSSVFSRWACSQARLEKIADALDVDFVELVAYKKKNQKDLLSALEKEKVLSDVVEITDEEDFSGSAWDYINILNTALLNEPNCETLSELISKIIRIYDLEYKRMKLYAYIMASNGDPETYKQCDDFEKRCDARVYGNARKKDKK